MTYRRSASLLLAAALIGCDGQRVPASAHHLPPEIATPPASPGLVRISRTGGTAQLLTASTLVPRQMLISGGLPNVTRILGVSGVEDQTVFAADKDGKLVAIDLGAKRSRIIVTSARQLVGSPDGIIFGIDSAKHPVRITNRQLTTFKSTVEHDAMLMRGPGDEILVTGNHPNTLQILNASVEAHHSPIPSGHVASTWTGDLTTVTTDSGVVFVDPTGKTPVRFVRIKGTPEVATFSPSGHRLYVARKTGGLVIVDRFLVMVDRSRRSQVHETTITGGASAMRVDRTGRWLLEHTAGGDSVRVIDLTAPSVATTEASPWDSDLPQVMDGKTLVLRRRQDLVAFDLSVTPVTQRAQLGGAANDLYVMLPWAPRTAAAATPSAIAVAPTGAPGTDSVPKPTSSPATPAAVVSAPAAPPVAGPPAAAPKGAAAGDTVARMYLQVSSSQNSEWAQAFAKQLKDGGFPARVLDPKSSDEGYRVVIGPYKTREDADAVGKRLGRSYFIISPGSGDT